jgi:hypothetical protein
MKFTCGIISDMALTLPANHIDSSGILYGNIYGTGKEDILPNGFSIPIIYCDQNHGNYAKDNTNYILHLRNNIAEDFIVHTKLIEFIISNCYFWEFDF